LFNIPRRANLLFYHCTYTPWLETFCPVLLNKSLIDSPSSLVQLSYKVTKKSMKPSTRFLSFIIFSSFSFSLFAQTEHQGVVGGPFHGYAEDDSGQVQAQVGPIADFAVPTGLSARALQNRIPSGDSSALEASLVLDDGTYTALDPSAVEWTFSKPHLTFDNGQLLAEVMPDRTLVKVEASAEGFTAHFIVFILPGDQQPNNGGETSVLPEVLRNAVELEALGWKESDWFGVFYDANNGWLFHADHGWLHTAGGGTAAAWFWNEEQEWFWTGPEIYPHLFRNRDAAWLYFFKQALPSRIFYNQQTEEFERLAGR